MTSCRHRCFHLLALPPTQLASSSRPCCRAACRPFGTSAEFLRSIHSLAPTSAAACHLCPDRPEVSTSRWLSSSGPSPSSLPRWMAQTDHFVKLLQIHETAGQSPQLTPAQGDADQSPIEHTSIGSPSACPARTILVVCPALPGSGNGPKFFFFVCVSLYGRTHSAPHVSILQLFVERPKLLQESQESLCRGCMLLETVPCAMAAAQVNQPLKPKRVWTVFILPRTPKRSEVCQATSAVLESVWRRTFACGCRNWGVADTQLHVSAHLSVGAFRDPP